MSNTEPNSNRGSESTVRTPHRYEFEQEETSIRTTRRAQESAKTFLERVKCKVAFDQLSNEEKVLITEYMIASVLNIKWYRKQIEKEAKRMRLYFFGSFALLLVIPGLLFGLSLIDFQPKNENIEFASLLTVVLSSFIAFHKAFSEWFKKRLRKGEYWRANAKIKENLYELEGKHDGTACRESNNKKWILTEDFKKSIFAATGQCRKIASDEQQAFFDQETLPSIDFGKAVTSAKTDATSLASAFRSSIAISREEAAKVDRQAAADLASAEDAVTKNQAVYDELDGKVHEISEMLGKASKEEKPDIEARLKTVKSEREKAYSELLASQIKLKKLRA